MSTDTGETQSTTRVIQVFSAALATGVLLPLASTEPPPYLSPYKIYPTYSGTGTGNTAATPSSPQTSTTRIMSDTSLTKDEIARIVADAVRGAQGGWLKANAVPIVVAFAVGFGIINFDGRVSRLEKLVDDNFKILIQKVDTLGERVARAEAVPPAMPKTDAVGHPSK